MTDRSNLREALREALRYAGHLSGCDWTARAMAGAKGCSCGYLVWRDRYDAALAASPAEPVHDAGYGSFPGRDPRASPVEHEEGGDASALRSDEGPSVTTGASRVEAPASPAETAPEKRCATGPCPDDCVYCPEPPVPASLPAPPILECSACEQAPDKCPYSFSLETRRQFLPATRWCPARIPAASLPAPDAPPPAVSGPLDALETIAAALHSGDCPHGREKTQPIDCFECLMEALGSARALGPAAFLPGLPVVMDPAMPAGEAMAVSVVQGEDGPRLDAVKMTGLGAASLPGENAPAKGCGKAIGTSQAANDEKEPHGK